MSRYVARRCDHRSPHPRATRILRYSSSMFKRAVLGSATLALIALHPVAAETFHLVKSLSGPSGKSFGAKFVLDETRSRFIYPQDKPSLSTSSGRPQSATIRWLLPGKGRTVAYCPFHPT